MNYNEALEFIKLKHVGQFRSNGQEYYHHPEAVALILRSKGFGIDFQIAGLFHDLLEDTDATEAQIFNLSNENVLTSVKLVTKELSYKPVSYINAIKKDDIATMVKIADRIHNLFGSIFVNSEFRKKYVTETKLYYYNLAKDTIFSEDLVNITTFIERYD